MKGVIVRAARESDAPGIAGVHVRSGNHAYRTLLPAAYLDSLSIPDSSERWRARLESPALRSVTWTAEVDGAIVGFCHVGPSPDEGAGEGEGHVYAIYVDPGFDRRGIGGWLIRAGIASLTELGFSEATLSMLVGNDPAREFYEGQGWRADGAVKTEELSGAVVREVRYRRDLS